VPAAIAAMLCPSGTGNAAAIIETRRGVDLCQIRQPCPAQMGWHRLPDWVSRTLGELVSRLRTSTARALFFLSHNRPPQRTNTRRPGVIAALVTAQRGTSATPRSLGRRATAPPHCKYAAASLNCPFRRMRNDEYHIGAVLFSVRTTKLRTENSESLVRPLLPPIDL
jgi:hypothetical protein